LRTGKLILASVRPRTQLGVSPQLVVCIQKSCPRP